MNISRLQKLVAESKLTKVQIAEQCGFTRVTLDNALQGADVKVSTIESLARVLGVQVSSLFEEDDVPVNPIPSDVNSLINTYKKEIEHLQTLLDKQRKATRVVVELDIDDDEFIKLGLKDKVIQILNK